MDTLMLIQSQTALYLLATMGFVACKSEIKPSETQTSAVSTTIAKVPKAVVPQRQDHPNLLLRQMGTHGIFMAKYEIGNVVSVVSAMNTTSVQTIPAASALGLVNRSNPLTTLGILADDFVPSGIATGRARVDCEDSVVVELKESDGNFLVSANHALQPRPVTEVQFTEFHVVQLARAVRFAGLAHPGNGYSESTTRAYNVDLDGDGSIETVLLAEGPVKEADETFTYSVVAVAAQGKTPKIVGYVQGETSPDSALYGSHAQLEAIADLDGDGRMELMVFHEEFGWHYHNMITYYWDGELTPMAEYIWAENDCYPNTENWTEASAK